MVCPKKPVPPSTSSFPLPEEPEEDDDDMCNLVWRVVCRVVSCREKARQARGKTITAMTVAVRKDVLVGCIMFIVLRKVEERDDAEDRESSRHEIPNR